MRRVAIIAIPTEEKDISNAFCKTIDTTGGENTFTVGLSPSGNAPVTHYWCHWICTESEYNKLLDRFTNYLYDGETVSPDQVLVELGLKPIQVVLR